MKNINKPIIGYLLIGIVSTFLILSNIPILPSSIFFGISIGLISYLFLGKREEFKFAKTFNIIIIIIGFLLVFLSIITLDPNAFPWFHIIAGALLIWIGIQRTRNIQSN
ncbi:hypothetical protein ATL39_3031 [Sinobaca qinghaiensis]|uniref:Uncharacterized protein n=1 Tax=Sinobaca qinghaiensis TaxID=342944 RepID=A0A419UWU5_9BACL|nr:hypothetical protein ATL39_3031 [Sinobaca qinghaiensis]